MSNKSLGDSSAIQSGGLPQFDPIVLRIGDSAEPTDSLHSCVSSATTGGDSCPARTARRGDQAAMIMAERPTGMARQIRNATFMLVDRGSSP
jgi:hypothetical protein